jgi:FixJ family two-component response regulator
MDIARSSPVDGVRTCGCGVPIGRATFKAITMQGSIVAVVDDDESIRESLPDLLGAYGYVAKAFASAGEFLTSSVCEADCLVVDIKMPGMSGPELRQELKRRGHDIPIIFITAQKDEAVCARLSGQDIVACLFKPFSERALLEALDAALEKG